MAAESKIEWTDATFNPWMGCTKVSPACDHCYASVSTPVRRFGVPWGAGQPRKRTSEANWRQPVNWNAEPFYECKRCGWRGESVDGVNCNSCRDDVLATLEPARRRVFCASLADVFDNEVDPQWRADLFDLIARTPNLDWLLLTKRIGNVAAMVPGTWRPLYPRNVWIGATVVTQYEADRDVPKLLKLPAVVRFLSMEPLLGPVDLTQIMRRERDSEWTYCDNALTGFRAHKCGGTTDRRDALDWVIVGGESGSGARPMRPSWVRSLRDQCKSAAVPFLFKQWGEWAPSDSASRGWDPLSGKQHLFHDGPEDQHTLMERVGKKAAGRALDGVLHTEYPEPRHAR